MNVGEREPFEAGKVLDSYAQTEESAPRTEKDPLVLNNDRKAVNRAKMNLVVPPSIRYRFESIVESERRLPNVVMDKVLSDFLSVPTCEPRPYIPYEIQTEKGEAFSIRASSDYIDRIKARAMSEGREWRVLVLRALIDYIRNSPDDPAKVSTDVSTVLNGGES